MKKYVENLNIEKFDDVNLEIINWKNKILKELKLNTSTWKRIVSWILVIIGSTGLIIVLSLEIEWDYFVIAPLVIIFFSCFIAALAFSISYNEEKRKIFKKIFGELNINPHTHWLKKINGEIKENEPLPENISRVQDYRRLKYNLSGRHSIGLKREYEILNSNIFDNDYTLSCGVWESVTRSRDKTDYYYDYLPLIKVKTNLFENEEIYITNSTYFSEFTKKDIQFENDSFNKKFSIIGTNENAARMIITPLVQNKWLEIEYLPDFKMEIKDGYINVLFKTNSKFMDIDEWSNLSIKKFKNIDLKIWSDIVKFLSILNLIFSIPIFQFEEGSK